MFHELWVGLADDEKYKYRLLGGIQRKLIKRLICKLEPKVIHTQTELYNKELLFLGFNSARLPLTSNIPLVPQPNDVSEKESVIGMVIFGSIYPDAPFLEFAQEIASYVDKTGQKVILTMIGRNGGEQEGWVSAFKSVGIPVTVMGEQSTETISKVLQENTLGVISTPFYLMEKSGSAAAMRLHQLPIINVAKSWRPKRYFELKNPEDVLVYKLNNLHEIKGLKKGAKTANSIEWVGNTFVRTLQANG